MMHGSINIQCTSKVGYEPRGFFVFLPPLQCLYVTCERNTDQLEYNLFEKLVRKICIFSDINYHKSSVVVYNPIFLYS